MEQKEGFSYTYCASSNQEVLNIRKKYPEGTAVKAVFSCTLGDTLVGWMVKTTDHAKFLGILRSDDGTLADQVVLPAGSYYIIAHYRNRYGVYSATPSPVFHIIGK